MNVKELKEKLQSLPDDARVDLSIPIDINNQFGSLTRQILFVEFDSKHNSVKLTNSWPVKILF